MWMYASVMEGKVEIEGVVGEEDMVDVGEKQLRRGVR